MKALLQHMDRVRDDLDQIDDQINALRLICKLEQSIFSTSGQPAGRGSNIDDDECVDETLSSHGMKHLNGYS